MKLRILILGLISTLLAANAAAATDSGEPAGLPLSNTIMTLIAQNERDIHFRLGSDHIEPCYREFLERVRTTLVMFPGLEVVITGHADRIGPADANLRLSRRRARAVAERLETMGIASHRISIRALGESISMVRADDSRDYGFDRRVHIAFKRHGHGDRRLALIGGR